MWSSMIFQTLWTASTWKNKTKNNNKKSLKLTQFSLHSFCLSVSVRRLHVYFDTCYIIVLPKQLQITLVFCMFWVRMECFRKQICMVGPLLLFVCFSYMHLHFMFIAVSNHCEICQMFFHCCFMYPHWGLWNKLLDLLDLQVLCALPS